MENYKIYKEISNPLNRWKDVTNKINVYIHNPFCKTICNYCIYKGTKYNEQDYLHYYLDYLPQQIDFYNEVLSRDNVDSYYFGGGTPTIVDVELLERIFKKIPNFKQKKKIIEIHPGVYNSKQIELFNKWGFNYILCIQTFDDYMLEKQNRVPYEFKDISRIKKKLHSDAIIMSDIIIFTREEFHTNLLRSDLNNMARLDVDEITVCPDFNIGYKEKLIKIYSNIISKFMLKHDFFIEGFKSDAASVRAMLMDEKLPLGLKLINKKTDFKRYYKELSQTYNIMSFNLNTKNNLDSTLGIGSFKNNVDTFSVINKDFIYIEVNDNWKPRYFEYYDEKKQKDLSKMISDFFKNKKPTPNNIDFSFSSYIEITTGKYKQFTKKLNYSISSKNKGDKEIQEYLKKNNV